MAKGLLLLFNNVKGSQRSKCIHNHLKYQSFNNDVKTFPFKQKKIVQVEPSLHETIFFLILNKCTLRYYDICAIIKKEWNIIRNNCCCYFSAHSACSTQKTFFHHHCCVVFFLFGWWSFISSSLLLLWLGNWENASSVTSFY